MAKKDKNADIGIGDEGTIGKTPEQIQAAKEKAEKRNEARKRVLNFIADNEKDLGSLADDIRMFVGKAAVARTKTSVRSVNTDLRDAFLEAGDAGLTEMDIFKKFRIGRPEMVTKIRILVLCPNPADRVWVKFDEPTETYHVVGTGANPPEGWDGYIPSSKVQGL